MLKAAILFASTSYFAWYLERHETAMVYPFDATYTTPAEAGETRLRETRVETGDGESLILWRVKARENRPTILYFPGNAGGLRDRSPRFSALIDQGYGIVAMGYRGSSGSSGAPDEQTLTEDARAVAALETARPLVLYGESLGTALALRVAAEGIGDAVVLEAPFTSFIDIVAAQYPRDDLGELLTQQWKSLMSARDVRQPLLVIHGDIDKVVPIALGREIFEAVGSTDKHFLEITGKGHRTLWTDEMKTELFAFLNAR
ncbi:MAG: alpha/beta hydrolase [Boseongicola sp.]|nr:alpha/beta hydrolase [Boseongicola sp.]